MYLITVENSPELAICDAEALEVHGLFSTWNKAMDYVEDWLKHQNEDNDYVPIEDAIVNKGNSYVHSVYPKSEYDDEIAKLYSTIIVKSVSVAPADDYYIVVQHGSAAVRYYEEDDEVLEVFNSWAAARHYVNFWLRRKSDCDYTDAEEPDLQEDEKVSYLHTVYYNGDMNEERYMQIEIKKAKADEILEIY